MAREYEFTRKQYKRVKALDHKQMESFVLSIYQSGYEEGRKAAAPDVGLSGIEEAIQGIKGIGVKKTAEIMAAISGLYKEAGKDVSGAGGESGEGRA